MVDIDTLFSASELADWKAYHFPRYIAGALRIPLTLTFYGALLAWGVSVLYRWADRVASRIPKRLSALIRALNLLWGDQTAWTAICFAMLVCIAVCLYKLPTEIYFGYIHEHRHGLSTSTLQRFVWDT